jgi:exoribonuclease-2
VVRRIVRTPARWERIVDIADEYGKELPAEPDSLRSTRSCWSARPPTRCVSPDLSLTIIKLLGNGELRRQLSGPSAGGHFGLAVREYTHSTAPIRRFPDLITQRLLRAALAKSAVRTGTTS